MYESRHAIEVVLSGSSERITMPLQWPFSALFFFSVIFGERDEKGIVKRDCETSGHVDPLDF